MGSADQPLVYPAYNARLSQMVREARDNNRRVEVVFLGDSMVTGSGGNGTGFPVAVATELAVTLGIHNTPASPWIPANESNDKHDFAIAHSANGGSTLSFTASQVVPLLEGKGRLVADSLGNGLCSALMDDQRHFMQMFGGRHKGFCNRAGTLLRNRVALQAILVDNTVIAGPNTTSLNATWRSNAEPKTNFSATLEATHNAVVATLIGNGWYRAQVPNAPASWTNRYLLCRLTGPGSGQQPGVAAVRFILTNTGGFAVTGAGKGGARAADLATNHAGFGPSLKAMGADIVVMAYGTNDAGGSVTAADFKAHTQTNINLVRAALPDCVIILLGGTLRVSAGDALLDTYVDKLAELADENTDVILFNERATLGLIGFNADRETVDVSGAVAWNSGTTYGLNDLVHIDALSTELVQGVTGTGRTYWRSNTSGNTNFQPGNDGAVSRNAWEPIKVYVEDGVHLTPLGNFMRARAFALMMAQASALGNLPVPTVAGEPGCLASAEVVFAPDETTTDFEFQLLDPAPVGSSVPGKSWPRVSWTQTVTPADPVLSAELMLATKYRMRRGQGPWVEFTTTTDPIQLLPETLGEIRNLPRGV